MLMMRLEVVIINDLNYKLEVKFVLGMESVLINVTKMQ